MSDHSLMEQRQATTTQTAGEAGWRQSRYNLFAHIPGTDKTIIANLFRGSCAVYTPIELYLLDELETLNENHPIIERFSQRGLIVNFDELEALKVLGHTACTGLQSVRLTICPTMGCNFDCPYCFENHTAGKMSQSVQDDVVALAGRMLDTFRPKQLHVTWFGGEPLLATDVIEHLSERLMALASEKGAAYQAYIITNGYLLTQPVADLLGRCKVCSAQITLDGIGTAHNATRHLAGGGPTFERIVRNLREGKLPFRVLVRQNIHENNRNQMNPLKAYIEKLAADSGNRLFYYPAPVFGNDMSDRRNSGVQLLCDSNGCDVGLLQDVGRFAKGRGHNCGANTLTDVGIDEKGRLQKCWEDVDKPERSFGTAAKWNPADPVRTADTPDRLTRYLNALPFDDAECRSCIWLPACAGGCPNRRLFYGQRDCLTYKHAPEQYVLALYERLHVTSPSLPLRTS